MKNKTIHQKIQPVVVKHVIAAKPQVPTLENLKVTNPNNLISIRRASERTACVSPRLV